MQKISMEGLRQHKVRPGSVAVWWLGQSGYLVKSPAGKIVAIDPYLTNSCKQLGLEFGFDMDRKVPPPLAPEGLVGVDLYAVTHSHRDHLDPATVAPYREAGGRGPFLAPAESVEALQAMGVPPGETITTWPNKTEVVGDMTLRATFAIPFAGDDLTHVGYLVMIDGGPTLYITGDTGYHDLIGETVRQYEPEVMIAVINGAFRNLGPEEAARLARDIGPKVVIPCHYDLFPDNVQWPHMLRTNLHIMGIGDRYRLLEHGVPFVYPETSSESG